MLPETKLLGTAHKNVLMSRYRNQIGRTSGIPAGIFLFKVNNRNTRTRCEICSKLTIKTSF